MIYIDSEEIKDINAFSKLPCSIGHELTKEEEEKIYSSYGVVRKVSGDCSYHIRGNIVVCTSTDSQNGRRYISDILLDMAGREYHIYGIRCGRQSIYEEAIMVLSCVGFTNCVGDGIMKVWERGNVRVSLWLERECRFICRIALQLI